MNSDDLDEVRSINPISAVDGERWAAEEGHATYQSVLEGGSSYVGIGVRDRASRSLAFGRVAAGLVVLAGLISGTFFLTQRDARSGRESPVAAGGAAWSGLLVECADLPPVEVDGTSISWTAVDEAFDRAGPFRLPERPDWMPTDLYCRAALNASRSVPPMPDGSENTVNGPNRFVVFEGLDDGEPVPVVMNQVLLQMYQLSVHDAFDPSGRYIGSFAPGLEYVATSEGTAEQVAADPAVRAAVTEAVDACERKECDDFIRATVNAGDDGEIGRPISLP